jgi:hypothetical protein
MKKLTFPYSINCADVEDRDTVIAFLITRGCFPHGNSNNPEDELDQFTDEYLYILVKSSTSFNGHQTKPAGGINFYRSITRIKNSLVKVIGEGDWVVALDTYVTLEGKPQFTEDELYKVKKIKETGMLMTELDESGSTVNGWNKSNFRIATKKEIEDHHKLPMISNYVGSIDGDRIKYGCAEFFADDFIEMAKLFENKFSNRTLEYISLTNGVKISRLKILQVVEKIKKLRKTS